MLSTACIYSCCHAQQSSSSTASIRASIVNPITIYKNADLEFGNILISTKNGGFVTISPVGTRTTSGGVTLTSGNSSAANFTINGQDNYTYTITLPETATNNNINSKYYTLDNFASNLPSNVTLSSGTQNVSVGATLTVEPAEIEGSYTTTTSFNLTVNYN